MVQPSDALDETRPSAALHIEAPTEPNPPIAEPQPTFWRRVGRIAPVWLGLTLLLALSLPALLTMSFGLVGARLTDTTNWITVQVFGVRPYQLAPIFTDEVDYWADDILRWSHIYNLDPNLIATVMQIESCGLASAESVAGAQGLFQVMPFHFEAGEVQTDPDTNIKRGAAWLHNCLAVGDGDAGLALACYNGGTIIFQRAFQNWSSETQRYYTWGTGIYAEASRDALTSPTLDDWLGAGGWRLCEQAALEQGRQRQPD